MDPDVILKYVASLEAEQTQVFPAKMLAQKSNVAVGDWTTTLS